LSCGHIFLSRRASEQALREAYAAYEQAYPHDFLLAPDNPLRRSAQERWTQMQEVLPRMPRRVLEIGCAYGYFLDLLPPEVERFGIEPSRPQSAFARDVLGLDGVLCATLEDVLAAGTWAPGSFDMLCSFHVIEHLSEPKVIFQAAERLLAEGGILAIACPEMETLAPNLTEIEYLAASLHLHTFTRDAMDRLSAFHALVPLASYPERNQKPYPGSSHAFLYVRVGGAERPAPARPPVERAVALAAAWHHEMDRRCARLKAAIEARAAAGKALAIYGGGVHTASIFNNTGVSAESVACIIDDDPAKAGTSQWGLPVLPLTEALDRVRPDVVVVSTLSSEDKLLGKLSGILSPETEVLGVYRDIMGPPFGDS